MNFDASTQTVVGNLGWVDKGALWTFDLRSQTEGRISVEGAQYLTLRPGSNGLFRLIHHQSADQAVSIRRVAEPGRELASVRYDGGRPAFQGDLDLWKQVDPAMIIQTPSGPRMRLINVAKERMDDLDLTWFMNGGYDLGYQGLVDCMSLTATETIVVSVQRSSKLVLIDPTKDKPVGSIELADRGGNPALRMRTANDFLASDYDTLCRVDSRSLTVSQSAILQGAAAPNTRQFIGDYDIGSGTCAVARSFSGDVLLLDSESLNELGRAQIGGQPLAVCLISESSVLTRDWKTGRVGTGRFQHKAIS
jgi:hypothetical protein